MRFGSRKMELRGERSVVRADTWVCVPLRCRRDVILQAGRVPDDVRGCPVFMPDDFLPFQSGSFFAPLHVMSGGEKPVSEPLHPI